MKTGLKKWFSEEFPQNFIIRRPLYGGLIIALFTLAFALIYHPLGAHPGRFLGFQATMLAYALISGAAIGGIGSLLIHLRFFSAEPRWTLTRELLAIFLLLFGLGLVIYLSAFVIEEPASRWNFPTFFDSVKSAFLIGIIPFFFFTLTNLRFLLSPVGLPAGFLKSTDPAGENMIRISSQLKKESLTFLPSQLIYAESDSNYVNFYLLNGDKVQKKVIRNAISEVEKELAQVPYFIRTHRTFIVNLKQVSSVKGNSMGYRLRMHGTDIEIPVSRTNTQRFSELCGQFS
jgi:hypothetical protein